MRYIKIRPEGGCGICGYIWQVLRAIYHYPNMLYYIDFSTSIYDDASKSDSNVWNYYFYQPDVEEEPTPDMIEKTVGIIDDPISEFRFNYLHNPTEEQIDNIRYSYYNIIQKYLKPLPHVQNKIDNFANTNFKNKRVLGIHFRGTDHPDKRPMKEYMPIIKDIAKKYDLIYVATDEEYRYKFIKAVFGDRVISYKSIKSETGRPLHHSFRGEGYQYIIGEDVIVEAFLLAKTDLICCFSNSNVNFLSRCISPEIPYIAL